MQGSVGGGVEWEEGTRSLLILYYYIFLEASTKNILTHH